MHRRVLLLLALVPLASCALTPMHKAGKAELDATLENWLDTYDDDFDEALSPDEVTKLADAMMAQHAAAKFEGTASKGSAPVNALSGAKMMEMMDKDGNGKASRSELMKFLHELKAKNAEMHGVEPPKIKDAVPDSSGEFASFGNYKKKKKPAKKLKPSERRKAAAVDDDDRDEL